MKQLKPSAFYHHSRLRNRDEKKGANLFLLAFLIIVELLLALALVLVGLQTFNQETTAASASGHTSMACIK